MPLTPSVLEAMFHCTYASLQRQRVRVAYHKGLPQNSCGPYSSSGGTNLVLLRDYVNKLKIVDEQPKLT